MRNNGRSLTRGVFALLLAAVLPSQAEAGQWRFWVQNAPPVVAQLAIVTGTPSAQSCPQGTGLGDGCLPTNSGNGPNTVQHADFFTGFAAQTSVRQAAAIAAQPSTLPPRLQYTARPQFNLPGIDYPVGIPAGTVLKDPVANKDQLPKGCPLKGTGENGYFLDCNGLAVGSAGGSLKASNVYTQLVLDGWDFSLHGGIRVLWSHWRGTFTVKNSKIGGNGPSSTATGNGWWTLYSANYAEPDGSGYDCFGSLNTCVTFTDNYIDGNIPNDPSIIGAIFAVNEGFTFKRNVLLNLPIRTFTSGSGQRPTLQDHCVYTNNYVDGYENFNNRNGAHGDLNVTNGPCGNNDYSYNTFLEPTRSGWPYAPDPAGLDDQHAQVSGWAFVFPSATIVAGRCPGVTFTGITGTVSGACTGSAIGQQNVNYGMGPGVTLVPSDGSTQVVNGYITAINGQDAIHYDGKPPTSFTMSENNEIPNGVNLKLKVEAPQYDVHHNVFVNNMWDVGSTNFGVLIGQLGGMTYTKLTIEQNWMDPTGAYGCFATDVASTVAASPGVHPGINYNLTNGGGVISGYSSTAASGCTPVYPGHSGYTDY